MRQATVLPPVAAADRHEVHLGHDERAADGRSDLRGAFLAETNMSVEIADRNVGLEARALAGRRLLLHGLDGHHLVLELASGRGEEVVDDLVLLDRPEFGKTSTEKLPEHTEGAVEVENF